MHELPCDPPDYGCSEGPPLVPCRPTVKHRSHSLQRKAYICELAELGSVASFDPTYLVIVAVAPFVCQIAVSALFEPSMRAQTIERSFHSKLRPTSRRSRHCWTTSRVNMPQLTAGVHFLGGRFPCLLSGCLLSRRAHRRRTFGLHSKRCNTIMTLRLSDLLLKDPRSRGKNSRSAIVTC